MLERGRQKQVICFWDGGYLADLEFDEGAVHVTDYKMRPER